MKAFIMAAGIGTRLRPMTLQVPKPMVSLVNKPVIDRTLDLLKKHNINDVIINLHTHPESIKNYFKDGKHKGMNISYSYEKKLLGTAGGLKKVESFFSGQDDFLVLSGDGVLDLNIEEIIKYHKKKKALATIILKKADLRFEYGVVLTERSGKIKKFIEKPYWSSIYENKVNTGVYVLNNKIFKYIPKNKFYDFGHQLWPFLLKKKLPLYAMETKKYWCDIGNFKEYFRATNDIINGNIKFNFKEEKAKKNLWIGKGVKLPKNITIRPPCVIGDYTKIGEKCVIGPNVVIGMHCNIKNFVNIQDSIVWDKVKINSNTTLNEAILLHNAKIAKHMQIYRGVILCQ